MRDKVLVAMDAYRQATHLHPPAREPTDYTTFNRLLCALLKEAAKDPKVERCTEHPDCLEDRELAVHCMGQQIVAGTWRDPA